MAKRAPLKLIRRRPTINIRAWLDDHMEETEETVMVADGLDDALIGITAYQPGRPICAVYDYEKCIRVFRKQGMSDEEAREWMEFNVTGAWMGDGTPVFLVTPDGP